MEQQEKNNIQRDEKFMRMAIDEARKALKEQEVPIGAVVVCGERVIGRGHNLVETLCDATAHAEMQSITAAAATLGGKYLKGCTLYVTVEPCKCVRARWLGARLIGWCMALMTQNEATQPFRDAYFTRRLLLSVVCWPTSVRR